MPPALLLPLLSLAGLAVAGVVLLLSVFAHEVGHAVAARRNGYIVTSLGVGTGRLLLRLRLPGTSTLLYICGFQRGLLGLTWVYPTEPFPARSRQLRLLLGGIVTNALLVAVALIALTLILDYAEPTRFASLFLLTVAFINGGMALITAVPTPAVRQRDSLPSDGGQALALLLNERRRSGNLYLSPRRHLQWRDLWETIGDTDALAVHLLSAAADYEEIGARRMALRCQEEAEQLSVSEIAAIYRRAWTSLLSMRLDQENSTEADLAFARLHSDGGRLLVARERLRRDTSLPWEERDTGLARLAEGIVVSEQPALLLRLLADRLVLLRERPKGPERSSLLELLSSRYEAASRRVTASAAIDRIAFSAIARLREEDGDSAGASLAHERAEESARIIHDALADDPDAQAEVTTAAERSWG